MPRTWQRESCADENGLLAKCQKPPASSRMSNRRNSDLRLWMFLIVPCCALILAVFKEQLIYSFVLMIGCTCFEVGRLKGSTFVATGSRYVTCLTAAIFARSIFPHGQIHPDIGFVYGWVSSKNQPEVGWTLVQVTVFCLCLGRQVKLLKQVFSVVFYVIILEPAFLAKWHPANQPWFVAWFIAAAVVGVLLAEPRPPVSQRFLDRNQSSILYVCGVLPMTFAIATWHHWFLGIDHSEMMVRGVAVFAAGLITFSTGWMMTRRPMSQFFGVGLIAGAFGAFPFFESVPIGVAGGVLASAAFVVGRQLRIRDELNCLVSLVCVAVPSIMESAGSHNETRILARLAILIVVIVAMALLGWVVNITLDVVKTAWRRLAPRMTLSVWDYSRD